MNMGRKILAGLVVVVLTFFGVVLVMAATINVPADYATIQAAINAAAAGDTINVAKGTYNTTLGETFPITVNKANLTIHATGTAANTIIDKEGPSSGSVVRITASGVTFDGFTVTGNPTWNGIEIPNMDPDVTSCAISNNIIKDNDYGINLYESYDNTITNNTIDNNGSVGIMVANFDAGGGNTITNNTITNNGGGINLMMTTGDVINYNNIMGNTYSGIKASFCLSEVNAEYNWWGSDNGSGQDGANDVSGNVDADPWLSQEWSNQVLVDDGFNDTTPDWQATHFDK